MADLKVLELEVREAEEALSLANAWFALNNTQADNAALAPLIDAVETTREALRAAVVALTPDVGTPATLAAKKRSPGTLMGAETTGLEATVQLRMDRVATSMAHLYALRGEPLVSVRVENKSADKRRRVSVQCHVEGYSAHAIASRELGKAGAADGSATFDLFPPMFPERTAALMELTAAALHVRVDDLDTGKTELVMAQPIPLLPPTTAVLGYRDPQKGTIVDQRELLAAWVTPNAPAVHEVLRSAVGSKLRAMIGYQAMTAADVRAQVGAIYDALAAAKIEYIDSRIAFGAGIGETLQRIRLPRESLKNQSANCIDGTVLMASLLEATGLDPFIVIVPFHAYLGYRPHKGAPDSELEYVETTVLTQKPFEEAVRIATDRTKTTPSILKLDVRSLRAKGITPME